MFTLRNKNKKQVRHQHVQCKKRSHQFHASCNLICFIRMSAQLVEDIGKHVKIILINSFHERPGGATMLILIFPLFGSLLVYARLVHVV